MGSLQKQEVDGNKCNGASVNIRSEIMAAFNVENVSVFETEKNVGQNIASVFLVERKYKMHSYFSMPDLKKAIKISLADLFVLLELFWGSWQSLQVKSVFLECVGISADEIESTHHRLYVLMLCCRSDMLGNEISAGIFALVVHARLDSYWTTRW